MVRTRVENDVLVVSVRLSVNLQAKTIEAVVSKMQRSHVQLLELLTGDLQFAGVPKEALMPLTSLRGLAEAREAEWFNSTRNYRECTEVALETQLEVFHSLAHETPAEMRRAPDKMKLTAMHCARSGQHALAVEMLCQWAGAEAELKLGGGDCGRERASSGAGAAEPHHHHAFREQHLGEVSEMLMSEELRQPWPATLVALASRSAEPHSRLPLPAFSDLVRRFVRRRDVEGRDPFGEDAHVLVQAKEGERWERATITGRHDAPAGAAGGRTYDVRTWREQPGLAEQHVLATDQGNGIGAALRVAASRGETELVDALLQAGASVFQTDEKANTALIVAAQGGQSEVCGRLVLNGDGRIEYDELAILMRYEAKVVAQQPGGDRFFSHSSSVITKAGGGPGGPGGWSGGAPGDVGGPAVTDGRSRVSGPGGSGPRAPSGPPLEQASPVRPVVARNLTVEVSDGAGPEMLNQAVLEGVPPGQV